MAEEKGLFQPKAEKAEDDLRQKLENYTFHNSNSITSFIEAAKKLPLESLNMSVLAAAFYCAITQNGGLFDVSREMFFESKSNSSYTQTASTILENLYIQLGRGKEKRTTDQDKKYLTDVIRYMRMLGSREMKQFKSNEVEVSAPEIILEKEQPTQSIQQSLDAANY